MLGAGTTEAGRCTTTTMSYLWRLQPVAELWWTPLDSFLTRGGVGGWAGGARRSCGRLLPRTQHSAAPLLQPFPMSQLYRRPLDRCVRVLPSTDRYGMHLARGPVSTDQRSMCSMKQTTDRRCTPSARPPNLSRPWPRSLYLGGDDPMARAGTSAEVGRSVATGIQPESSGSVIKPTAMHKC